MHGNLDSIDTVVKNNDDDSDLSSWKSFTEMYDDENMSCSIDGNDLDLPDDAFTREATMTLMSLKRKNDITSNEQAMLMVTNPQPPEMNAADNGNDAASRFDLVHSSIAVADTTAGSTNSEMHIDTRATANTDNTQSIVQGSYPMNVSIPGNTMLSAMSQMQHLPQQLSPTQWNMQPFIGHISPTSSSSSTKASSAVATTGLCYGFSLSPGAPVVATTPTCSPLWNNAPLVSPLCTPFVRNNSVVATSINSEPHTSSTSAVAMCNHDTYVNWAVAVSSSNGFFTPGQPNSSFVAYPHAGSSNAMMPTSRPNVQWQLPSEVPIVNASQCSPNNGAFNVTGVLPSSDTMLQMESNVGVNYSPNDSESKLKGICSGLVDANANDTVKPDSHSGTTTKRSAAPSQVPPLAKMCLPFSAYNYFYRNERDNIVQNMKHSWDPIPEPVHDFSETKKQELLYQHWYVDPYKGKRQHRAMHGRISFKSLTTVIAERWKSLPRAGRDFYRDVAKADQEMYDTFCPPEKRQGQLLQQQ